MLTAAHVIGRPGRKAWIELPDGRRLKGRTLGGDHDLDAADATAAAAGIFTTNLAQAAPVLLSRKHLQQSAGHARGVVINSGCANACTGADGMSHAEAMVKDTASAVGCDPVGVLVAFIPLVWAGLHVVRSASSYPGGWLSDRLGPRAAVAAGGLLVLLLIFFLGKRSGKKKSTIVEVRRF